MKQPELEPNEITLPLIQDGCAVKSPPNLVTMVDNGETAQAKFTVRIISPSPLFCTTQSVCVLIASPMEWRLIRVLRFLFSELRVSIRWVWYRLSLLSRTSLPAWPMPTGMCQTRRLALLEHYIAKKRTDLLWTLNTEVRWRRTRVRVLWSGRWPRHSWRWCWGWNWIKWRRNLWYALVRGTNRG